MARKTKVRTVLFKILGAITALLVLALLWVSLILGQPQSDEKNDPVEQPLLASVPSVTISKETDLPELLKDFPIPLLSFMSGSGMTFVSGTAADLPLESGFGRTVTLYWQTDAGLPMTLQSIYPASALNVLEGNSYSFSAVSGPALCGLTSVRMENDDTERIHIRTDEGVYAVTVPLSLSGELSTLTKSLQLFTSER